jgi:formyltetrahydrofolate-dependent phosphoribosylglycinamide formyltransferase
MVANDAREPFRLAVLISGNGSNLQAIIDAVAQGTLPAQICVVVSNRGAAYGLERARNAGIGTLYFPLKPYREANLSRERYDADLAARLSAYRPDLVVLAGWMHIFSPTFLTAFDGRVLNLHPAQPGQYPGTHSIERAYRDFQAGLIEHTGLMVHIAVPEVDAGPVVATTTVPIYPTDSLEDLEARAHAAEHDLLVHAIRQVIATRTGVS